MTGLNRCDVRNYDIVIDLSCVNFELAKNFIFDVMNFKFFQKGGIK